MANKVRFTPDRIENFPLPPEGSKSRQVFYWDTDTPGLLLRVAHTGLRTYGFETRLSGKTVRKTIGDVRTFTLAEARTKAKVLSAQVAEKLDPRELARQRMADAEKRKADGLAAILAAEAERKRLSLTVSEAWAAYIAYQADKMKRSHIERGKKWGERHMRDHLNLSKAGGATKKRGTGLTIPGPLFPLLAVRMCDVTADSLKAWLRTEADLRANKARQALEMFRAFWRWCATQADYRALIDAAAVESKELLDEKPARRAKSGDSVAKGDLQAWFAAVRNLSGQTMSAYLQALMLTGARREEMAQMRWEHVDFRAGSIWLHDKVEAHGRVIPLTPYLRSLLLALKTTNDTPPREFRILAGRKLAVDVAAWKPSPWVFASKTAADGRLGDPSNAHKRALAAAGLPNVTLHGLRRTYASLCEWTEMPQGVVAQIMGHKPSATAERHYKTRPLELLAIWAAKYEAFILAEAGIIFDKKQEGLRLVGAD